MVYKGYYEDLTHKEFGNLIVDSFAYVKDTHSHWIGVYSDLKEAITVRKEIFWRVY